MKEKRRLKPWKPLYVVGGLIILVITVLSCGLVLFLGSNPELLDEAITLPEPQTAEEYLFRGIDFGDMGDHEKAIQDFIEAIRLDPKFARAYYNRGITYNRLQRFQAAIDDFSTAIALDSENGPAYANRAFTYTLIGKDAEASADIERAVELGFDRERLEETIAGAKLSR